jgi:hypothetical protein
LSFILGGTQSYQSGNRNRLTMGDTGTQPVLKPQTIYTFDDVIRERAVDEDQNPLIAYPKSSLGITDYEFFDGRQLDRLVDGAAKYLLTCGVRALVRSPCPAHFQK